VKMLIYQGGFIILSFYVKSITNIGPIVQWQNASIAWMRPESDSPWVHKINEP